jgi:hypothetical protein
VYRRIEFGEEAFKNRYNRNIQAYLERVKDGKKVVSVIKIISPKKKEYVLKDFMENGETVEATLSVDGKEYKYSRYIDAEIHCADLIGAE